MACLINRNESSKITSVSTPSGQRSQLFDAIHSNIFLADAETSIKVLNNAYTDKMLETFSGATENVYETGEPKLFYKSSKNKEYDNLEELLINEDFGNITMGFKHPSTNEFIPISKLTNKGSVKNEFLTDKVKEGLLSAERVLEEDGITRYQGKGQFENTKVGAAWAVAEDLKLETGNGRVKVNKDGTLEMEFSNGYSKVKLTDGTTQVIRTENIPEFLKNNEAENVVDLILEYTIKHESPRPVDKDVAPTKRESDDVGDMEKALFGFLEDLGFTTTTLESYRKNYNTKFGKDPDIQALADLSNMVVAFREGTISMADLSEEVAHIAIEAFSDQNSITAALVNIHLTPEYAEFAEYYREKYAPFFKGIELEDHVRKEVLGKVLKREFITRFNTQNKTQGQIYLIEKLSEIWQRFMDFIGNRFKPYHRVELNKLNTRIADSVLNNTSEDFLTDLKDNENFFYNAMDSKGKSVQAELMVAKRAIEDLFRTHLKQPVPNQSELDRLMDASSQLDILNSFNTIVNIAETQMNVLEINANESSEKGELMSSKDSSRYEVLRNNLVPSINSVKVQIREQEFSPDNLRLFNNLVEASNRVGTKMLEVEPLMDTDKKSFVKKLYDKILSKVSLSEEQKEELRKGIDGGIKDTGWIGRMFGLASHSKNPIIQMLQYKIIEINSNTTERLNSRANEIITEVDRKGLLKYQKSIIQKDGNGNNTHYLRSFRDYHSYDVKRLAEEDRLIAKLANIEISEVKKLREKFRPSEIIKDEAKVTEYRKAISEWNQQNTVRRMKDNYYEEGDERFKTVNASDATIDYMRSKNSGMFARRIKYRNPDGTIDLSKQTEADKIEDDNDKKRFLSAKSAYDTTGYLKDGLRRVSVSELTQEEINSLPFELDEGYTGDVTLAEAGKSIDDLTPSSRMALDIFNLDMLRRQELKDESRNNEPLEQFLENIKDIEEKGEVAFNWLMANSSISLSSDFYENIGQRVSYNEIAQGYVDGISDEKVKAHKQLLLEDVIAKKKARKELLKQNRKAGSAIDTDVHHMTTPVRKTLLDLDTDIAEKTRELNIPQSLFEEMGEIEGSESSLNEDYQKMLTASGLEDYDFVLDHTADRGRLTDFNKEVSDYLNKRRTHVKPHFDDFIAKISETGVLKGVSKEEALQILKNEYAKVNVASYFKRFQPVGYTETLAAMKNGEISITELLENKEALIEEYPALKYIEIIPEYSWSSDVSNNEYLNPDFKSKGPRHQPKDLNMETFEHFGIRVEDYLALDEENLRLLTPTKNKEEYEFLTLMTELNEEAAEQYGDKDVVNKYQRVQISKSRMETVINIHKGTGANIKDLITDIVRSKVDEKEYGEEIEDTGIMVKVIPKYYQTKLEDAALVSENTLESAILNLKSAIKYNEKVKIESDVEALRYQISQQNFKNSGGKGVKSRIFKKGEVSNYLAKAQEMIDAQMYGIRESRQMVTNVFGREVDFTQIFKAITNYVRTVNLAFSVVTDATSYTTGVYNNFIDRVSGDYYHKSSVKKSTVKIPALIGKYLAESGAIKKSSELNHWMEFAGVIDLDDRLKESSMNRVFRMASKSYFAASQLANLPVTPKNALSIIYDHKYHNGRFKSFNDFAIDMRIEDKTISKKVIEASWSKITEDFSDNVTVDPNKGVVMNNKFTEKFGENSAEEFRELRTRLVNKISQVNQSVDSIVSPSDQTAAQRDALTNALLLHRGWFMINLTRKFKGRHFNIAAGQFEEGHYINAFKTLKRFAGSRFSAQAREEFKNSSEDFEKRNFKRMRVSTIASLFLIGLTNMLLRGDDDDDTMIENFAQLIALRTTSEAQSLGALGILGSSKDIYEQPIVQVGMFENIYKALTKDENNLSYIGKNILIYRRYKQLSDLQNQINSYQYFNSETLLFVHDRDYNKEQLSESSAIRILD